MHQSRLGKGSLFSLAAVFVLLSSATDGFAELRIDQPIVDVGTIRSGVPLTQRFEFVNAGAEEIEITGAQASCGCLTPKLTSLALRPGEKAALVLEVNTLTQSAGPKRWSVRLCYKTPSRTYETTLLVSARIITEILVQPASLTIYAADAVEHEITVSDTRTKPFAVTEARSSSEHIIARVGGPTRDAAGHQVNVIHLRIAKTLAEGEFHEAVEIVTNDPLYRSLRVPVTVSKRAKQTVAATPDNVSFILSPGGPAPSRLVLIRDSQGSPIEIDRVESAAPALLFSWPKGPHSPSTIKIQVDRTRMPGNSLDALVHVHIRQPAAQILTIPVRCTLE